MTSYYNPPLRDDEFIGNQVPLPNATLVLILGILSIVACCCYGIPGLILAIITIAISGSSKKQYLANPAMYIPSSYSNLKAGRVCAICALVFSILTVVAMVAIVAAIGIDVLSDPEALQEYLQQLQQQYQ